MSPDSRSISASALALVLCLAPAVFAGPAGGSPSGLEPASETPEFGHLTGADGLPHNTAYAVLQDGTGFLWIGTEAGLSRYDGYSVVTYYHDPTDPDSLADDDVSALAESRDGQLWIATWGGGLDRFDPRSERFIHHDSDPEDPGSLADGRLQAVFEDRDGTVWVGTYQGGLSRLDRGQTRFRTYRHDPADPTSLSHDRVWSIVQDPLGLLWVGTEAGISVLDVRNDRFEVFRTLEGEPSGLAHATVRSLYVDRSGVIWAGTENGLQRFHRPSKTFERLALGSENIGAESINAIYEDRRGGLWIGTHGGGLVKYDRRSGTAERFRSDPQDPRSLGDNDLRAFWEDRSGVLWIATRGAGLSRLDLKPKLFHHVYQHGDPAGLSSPRVRAFAEDRQGRLWVGTSRGLNRHLGAGLGFAHFRHDPDDPASLPDDHVHHLLLDGRGQLWVAAWRGGLSRWVEDSESFVHLRHDPGDPDSLADDAVTALYEDSVGELWVGTRRGLDRFDRKRSRFEHFRHDPGDDRSLSESYVRTLYEDRGGSLWVGTDSAGLNRFDRGEQRFERFRHDPRVPDSLSNDRVNAILEINAAGRTSAEPGSGSLWVGTSKGLNQRLAGGGFRRFFERDGLPSSHVVGLLGDGQGRLWISTHGGLARLDAQTGEIRSYGVRHGLQGRQFARGAYFQGADGRMYFGGENGFNVFDPEQLVEVSSAPAVVLTGIRRFGKEVDLGLAPPAIDAVSLSHEDAYFSFEYAALDFTSPEHNRYRYRLEGFDPDWVDAGDRRRADYVNVAPGNYRFRVQASNSDGVWNEEGLSVDLSIEPPLWGTAWFRSLFALVVVTTVGAIVRYRVLRHRRRERELARRVEEGMAQRRVSEERYRLLFERNLAGVVRAAIDGPILDCNDAFAQLLGYESRKQCLHQPALGLGDDPDRHQKFLEKLRREGRVVSYEHALLARDGSTVPLLWNAHLVVEEGGKLVIEGTVIDIRERRRMEEDLLRTQKLESLAVLAGGIAHDFNNLLTAILGHAELAQGQLPPGSPALKRLQHIERAAERAAGLSKQMLAYSGQGSFHIEAIGLSSVVEEMAGLLEGAVSKKVVVRYDLHPDLPPVDADASQLGQVLLSLVTNASEAIDNEESGIITIATGARRCDREYLSETYLDEQLKQGLYAYLEVRDNGCGMDRETQLKIFDPFFTTKFTGRGLGLAAVLGIVRGHEGAIKIESEPGIGTAIRALFPAAERRVEDLAEPRRAEETWRGSGNLLLVDDEEQVRLVGREMAELLGFNVLTANDGRDGVDTFRGHADSISLVVLDLAMPRMDGLETFREIRQIKDDARVLLATGYDEHEMMQRHQERGFAGFIQKPYRLADLRDKVKAVMEG